MSAGRTSGSCVTEKLTKRAGLMHKCCKKECGYVEVIDPNADGKNGVVPYLPLPALNPPASSGKGQ